MPPCPSCASALVQALRWEPGPDAKLDVRLRCPECESCFRRALSVAAMRDLDAGQAAAREALLATYERLLADSMEALADCFEVALARDLLTADDFAPRPAAP